MLAVVADLESQGKNLQHFCRELSRYFRNLLVSKIAGAQGPTRLIAASDENGRVIETRNTGAQAGFGMDEAAVDYARSCTYANATKNGTPVKMWLDLKVSFSLGG